MTIKTQQGLGLSDPNRGAGQGGPVECLGKKFADDAERREHYSRLLAEKLKDPEFRNTEGFPVGEDKDILALSDPPYYTACPNPFLEEFIRVYGKPYDVDEKYRNKPYSADVSEGKRDPLYEHYSYHTKVPHKAIAKYLSHFTKKNDIVLDAFGGSGMTGLAGKYMAQVDGDERNVILSDLSTYASFISSNYSSIGNHADFSESLNDVETSLGWMYKTKDENGELCDVNYYVWSDIFSCPECGDEVVFFDQFVDQESGKVLDSSVCQGCNSEITKSSLDSIWESLFDSVVNEAVSLKKQKIVLIKYFKGKSQLEKKPDQYDLELMKKVEEYDINKWVPKFKLPPGDNTNQPINSHGITYSHLFFTKRNLIALSELWEKAENLKSNYWKFELLGCFRVWTKRSIFLTTAWKKGGTGAFKPSSSGILYVPSISGERNVLKSFSDRLKKSNKFLRSLPKSVVPTYISNSSTGDLKTIPDDSIDYVFIDPPFGGNIMYSELNMVFEPWLKLVTNNTHEAICNKSQNKKVHDYANMMFTCFDELNRVLKPGRWLTIEFHNSKNSIWNAIQDSLQKAGFVVADVRVLDKKQGTFKQYTSSGAVKQDLVISAYKTTHDLEDLCILGHDNDETAWEFVRSHMTQLPVFVSNDGVFEIISERLNYLLFDRMVAFHVQRGISVPISASDFYLGLEQRYSCRDEMYFLPEQVSEYEKKRLSAKEIKQLEIAVSDESSAIDWIRQKLLEKPREFREIQPMFMKEVSGWKKHEKTLELLDILDENFLKYDGEGPVPSSIHSYLSSNYKDLRGKGKTSVALRDKAKDRWYAASTNNQEDLLKKRDKALLKEFEGYLDSGVKKLKLFRLEAVRAGFKYAWQERDYKKIVTVAEKIPDTILHEDQKMIMWYDQALTRLSDESLF